MKNIVFKINEDKNNLLMKRTKNKSLDLLYGFHVKGGFKPFFIFNCQKLLIEKHIICSVIIWQETQEDLTDDEIEQVKRWV